MPEPDSDNWQLLLARHRAALFLMARQYLTTREEAEDAVHDGFVKFWKSRTSARDPLAYLFTCVRNAALDLRRARNSGVHASACPPLSLLEPSVEQEERRDQIETALAQIPSEQREVLVLKIWSELTFAQVAEVLKIPPNTAASRYRYALQNLEPLLAKEFKS
ncbi:MAG: sigma-70 family RNA polymerase sigma factor [Phycisphaerales bacterium]|nr:sigma-70 family RNA polymerase sigma factor [Phycisphaerales bacterium]